MFWMERTEGSREREYWAEGPPMGTGQDGGVPVFGVQVEGSQALVTLTITQDLVIDQPVGVQPYGLRQVHISS